MEIVVLIPGLMGSQLYHPSAGRIWPAGLLQLWLPYRHEQELSEVELEVGDIIRRVGPVHVYDRLIEDLEQLGFTDERLVIFPFDWRRDNALAARQLGVRLREVVEQLGEAVQINLVAHSLGGLVARYFLEANDPDLDTSARAKVVRFISLGTPHRGAPLALTAALGEESQLYLSARQVHALVSNPAFPSLYQLLPRKGDCFVWDGGPDSRERRIDVWDSTLVERLGLVAENLEQACAFHDQLGPERAPKHVEYFSFFGTRHVTMNHIQLVPSGEGFRTRRGVFEDAGDAAVPVWSGLLPGSQAMPVGGEHFNIFTDASLRSTLGALLGRPDVLAGNELGQLSLARTVVDTDGLEGEPIGVSLTLGRATSELSGRLWWTRSQIGEDADETSEPGEFEPVGDEQPISLRGPRTEHLRLELAAPSQPGCYRLCFAERDRAIISGELVVQERSTS